MEAPAPRGVRETPQPPLLERLYEITQLLSRFEGVETTVPALLAVAARSVPICSAIVIEKIRGRPRVFVWHSPHQSEGSILASRAHALREFSYLAGSAEPLVDPETFDFPLEPLSRARCATEESPGHYVVLPLVVARMPIFGALQIEAAASIDRAGLSFLNAIANQLSVSLDRYYVRLEHAALLAEAVRDYAIFMLDLHGNISSWNVGAESLTGYTAEEIVGKHLSRLYPAEDAKGQVQTELEEASGRGRAERQGWRVRKDGSRFWARSVTTALRDAAGRLVGFARTTNDLTERRKAEEALRAAEETLRKRTRRLEEAVADLEAFSHTVSHNLRGPLRAVQGYAFHVLKNAGERLDADSRHMLDRLSRAALRMDRLIQDLLAYSQVRRTEYVMAPVDLDPLVAHIVEDYPNRDRAEIRCRAPLGKVLGQESLVTQAVSNLIENAAKFMPAARKAVVEIWSEKSEGSLRLNVRDNGIGIAKEYHEKIFQPFARLAQAEKYEGTGIGLTIVKKAVERMGGRVGVESEIDKGSRFWIDLPAAG